MDKAVQKVKASELELKDKVVNIRRVAKVTKGGRTFSFSAIVVVGDGNGIVGHGLGKAREVQEAITKGIDDAKKNLVKVPVFKGTIPHEVHGKFGAGKVLIKPAADGTGVIAGSAVRAIMDVCGIKDIRTKIIGSTNPQNVLRATVAGLLMLDEPDSVAALRGKRLEDMGYHPYTSS